MKHKKIANTILLFMFILLFTACKHNTIEEFTDKDGNQVIREWYNKSHIKSIKTFTNPERTSYRYMEFYRDGLLKDSAVFIEGRINGLHKFYDASSGLMHFENYKNGVLNGPQKAVFSSGISSFEGYRKDNNKVGEWKFYYPDGNMITYEYYDSTGRLKYLKKYDQDGSILKTDGSGLIDVVLQRTDFKLQEPVEGYAIVAIPFGCSIRLSIKDLTEGAIAKPFFDKQIVESPVFWAKTFNSTGTKKLLFTLILTDDQTGEKEQSVFEQPINIVAD